MLTLIEGAQIHSPAPLGQQDLLVADGRIAWMGKGLTVPVDWPLTRVDAGGRYLVPGLVDPLAHITGGGGEEASAFARRSSRQGKLWRRGSPRSWRPSAPTA